MAQQEEQNRKQTATETPMPPPPEQELKEPEQKPLAQYNRLFNTLDYLFGGNETKELVTSLLTDLRSNKSFFEMGFTMTMKVLWFGIRHPGHALNLLQANNKDIFQDPEFQRKILENENTWKFVSSIGDNLPLIGVAMRQFGIKEFEEGKILDQESLNLLKGVLKDSVSQKLLKEMAILYTTQSPDKNNQIILKALELMEKGESVKAFFSAKSVTLTNYIVETMQENIKTNPDLQKTFAGYGITADNLKPLSDIIPILLGKPAALKNIYQLMSEGKTTEMVTAVLGLMDSTPAIAGYIKNNQTLFVGAFNEYAKGANFNTYGLKPEEIEKLSSIVPILVDRPKDLQKIYQLMSEGKMTEMVTAVLDLMDSTPAIAGYIKDNQALFVAAFNEYAKGANFNTYGLKPEEVEKLSSIVPILVDRPKDLQKIYQLMSEGKTTEMVTAVLDLMDSTPAIAGYIKDNQELFVAAFNEYAKGANFNTYGLKPEEVEKLSSIVPILVDRPKDLQKIYQLMSEGKTTEMVTAVLDLMDSTPAIAGYIKDNKSLFIAAATSYAEGNEALKGNLTRYGLTGADLDKMADIVPIMVNQPAILKEIYQNFSTGNYIGIAKAALASAESEPGIQQYFKENQQLFAGIIEKVIQETPSLQAYNLSGNIYEIVPTLLEHPKELSNILKLYEASKTVEAGEEFIKLAMKDEKLRGFFVQNKAVAKGVMNQAGLEAYGVGEEVLDIVDNLMKSANMEKFPVIIDLYKQGKWNELVIETCRMIENDPEFSNYLKTNSDNFAKIFSAAIDKMPEVQSYLGEADVGQVLSNVIKDPRSIRELVEGYEQYQKTGSKAALAAAGTRFIAAKAFDYDFRQALYGAASGWLFGSGIDKQSVVNKITAGLNGLEPEERINLNDFARAAIDIAGISDEGKKAQLTDALAKNNLFNGMHISGNDAPVVFTNLDINSNKFVNSKLDNVRFKNCKLTGVSFARAEFINVDFSGSEIDGYTFSSLIPALKAGSISLDGVRVVGNLPAGLDLAGVDLRGADLSGVASMKGVNLAEADLRGATLPNKEGVLEWAYNLDKARLDKGVLTDDMLRVQEQMIASDIASNFKDLTATQKTALESKIQELYQSNAEFRAVITASPSDFMWNMALPLKTDGYSHVSDYRDKTANMLDLIYHHRLNPDNLEIALAANSIADQITAELFGEGNNRGQDGLLIRKMVSESLTDAIKSNPGVTLQMVMQSDHLQEMVTAMTEDIRAVTKYTTAGLATGGIYLPKEAVGSSLTAKITTHFNDAHRFSKAEMEQIHAIAGTVGSNLFNAGAASDRKQDVDFIYDGIKEVVAQLKEEKGGADVAEMLKGQQEKIAGTVERGYLSNAYTGLTQIYQAASSYTTAGLATGGIYLKEEVAKGQDVLSKVKEEFAKVLAENQHLKSTKTNAKPSSQPEAQTKGNSAGRT